jgi:hypothetical protein
MALEAGTRLGPYEVLSVIGAGEDERGPSARDTRLDCTGGGEDPRSRAAQIGSHSGEQWLCLNARPARAYCSVHRVDRLPFCLRRSKVGPSGLSADTAIYDGAARTGARRL